MYIELSILNGEGYISTFSDNAVSIACKPVHASEIQSIVQDLSKNKTLSVQENSDKTTFFVRERSQIKQQEAVTENQSEQIMKSFNETGKIHYQDKANVEFSRYKQDCRKRALELAFEEVKFIGGFTDTAVKVTADKYYSWLIDIK